MSALYVFDNEQTNTSRQEIKKDHKSPGITTHLLWTKGAKEEGGTGNEDKNTQYPACENNFVIQHTRAVKPVPTVVIQIERERFREK